ncbi:MAG: FtsX-like permease family protein [Desulfobacterales bacterium]|nr:FtsX-like permease family protein [Desulfobacterales bacterium]
MFSNYLITAIRSLARNKMASGISIIGLALGISCALLIFLFIQFELSFDDFHTNRDRIYRVLQKGIRKTEARDEVYISSNPYELTPKLQGEFPGIESVVRLTPQIGVVKYGDRKFEEGNFYFTDPGFFGMFDFPLKSGNPDTALAAPNTVVLTEEMAEKYFGEEDPMGKVIKLKVYYMDQQSFTVTGVLRSIPRNSSIRINFLARKPFDLLKKALPRWMPYYAYTYIKLIDGASENQVAEKLSKLKMRDFYSDALFFEWNFILQPFKDLHFYNEANYRSVNGRSGNELLEGNLMLIFLLAALSIMILVISCINVMNLSTARSANRAKEIGVRKVIGADRGQLIVQFLTESILMALLSLVLSIALVEASLKFFNTMIHRDLVIDYANNAGYLISMGGLTVMVGLFSGLYPAFFLSSLHPVKTLKGENAPASITLRKTLMITQIVVSICIFIFSFLITREVGFLRDKPLGFDTERVIVFKLDDLGLGKKYPGFKKSLLGLPGVSHVTLSAYGTWGRGTVGFSTFSCLGTDAVNQQQLMLADPDYLRVFKIPVVEGENFPENKDAAENMCIINKAAKKELGFDDVLGRKLRHGGFFIRRIIGVVDDFHYRYPTEEIRPLVIVPADNYYGIRRRFISVRLLPGAEEETIAKIGDAVKNFFPNLIFQYAYVDKEIERMHAARNDHFEIALKFSTGFSIFIACLGLFGFAEYETTRKTKEVGIRKALGAGRVQIALHFVKGFVKMTIIANIIAWPISFYLSRRILAGIGYPYSFNMGLSIFILAGLTTLLLTALTTCVQTTRAASVNPVDALRDE